MLLCWQAGGHSLYQPVWTKCCAICEVAAQCNFIPVSNSLHTRTIAVPNSKFKKKTELHSRMAVGSILRKLWQDVIFFKHKGLKQDFEERTIISKAEITAHAASDPILIFSSQVAQIEIVTLATMRKKKHEFGY